MIIKSQKVRFHCPRTVGKMVNHIEIMMKKARIQQDLDAR